MSIDIFYRCARRGCDATESVDVEAEAAGGASGQAVEVEPLIGQLMPEGWGYDLAGLDEVLHCPEHRGKT